MRADNVDRIVDFRQPDGDKAAVTGPDVNLAHVSGTAIPDGGKTIAKTGIGYVDSGAGKLPGNGDAASEAYSGDKYEYAMELDVPGELRMGRECYERRAWADAYQSLSLADELAPQVTARPRTRPQPRPPRSASAAGRRT